MKKVPQNMMAAIPEGCEFLRHETGSTWNDGGSWHRVFFQKPDGSGGVVQMETDYRSHDLTIEDVELPPPTYSRADLDAAVAAAYERALTSARAALAQKDTDNG